MHAQAKHATIKQKEHCGLDVCVAERGQFRKLLQYYQKFNSSEKKIISEVSSREGKRE